MSAESRATASVDPWIGRTLAGRYRLDELIGAGGMSTVYRALDTTLGRTVAVKLFRPELAGADDIRRQRDEVRLLASLNHPTLVTLFDAVSTDDGRAFLVLEYVDGDDLRATMDGGTLSPARVAAIGADVADALAWVHHRGIVHRDVKPANVLVPRRGDGPAVPHAKLADFGIARLLDSARMTTTGSVIGTADFLSPEQATGSATGAATDVYSLGLVLLECLTGERAFGGTAIESVVARLSRDPEIPDELSREWARSLSLMTRRAPEERPSASEVSSWLRAIASGADTGPDPTLVLPIDDETAPLAASLFPDPHGGDTVTEKLGPAATPTASSKEITTEGREGATERLSPASVAVDDAPSRKGPRRRTAVIIGVIVAVAIAVAVVAAIVVSGVVQAGHPAGPGVDYPVVDGELGRHLEQLQRSVER